MQLEQKIKTIGIMFVDRLSPEVLSAAIGYVDFSECRLAIEILCDQLFEYDVQLTAAEFQQLAEIVSETGADFERLQSLQSLVQSQ